MRTGELGQDEVGEESFGVALSHLESCGKRAPPDMTKATFLSRSEAPASLENSVRDDHYDRAQ